MKKKKFNFFEITKQFLNPQKNSSTSNNPENLKVVIHDENFQVKITRKNRLKNIHIRLDAPLTIRLSCSKTTSLAEIQKALHKNQNWIIKTHEKLKLIHSKTVKFIQGELHEFNGQKFPLNLKFQSKKRSKIYFIKNTFQALISMDLSPKQQKRELEKLFEKFYKEETRVFCQKKLKGLQKIHHFSFKNITVKKLRSRWGSCSKQGNLNFNQDLAKLPESVRNYVIVHEYAHLKELNHSKKFWKIVEFFEPEYKKERKMLRDYK